jgi:hypothetical protein
MPPKAKKTETVVKNYSPERKHRVVKKKVCYQTVEKEDVKKSSGSEPVFIEKKDLPKKKTTKK